MERTIRATIDRANSDLQRVNAASLNPQARSQYRDAAGLIRQAESLLGQKNFSLARVVADRAAKLAAQLAGK